MLGSLPETEQRESICLAGRSQIFCLTTKNANLKKRQNLSKLAKFKLVFDVIKKYQIICKLEFGKIQQMYLWR